MKFDLPRTVAQLSIRQEYMQRGLKVLADLTRIIKEMKEQRNTAKEKQKNNREFPYRKIERRKNGKEKD